MFKINGTLVAEPAKEGITVTHEPIWAPNTGRGSDGKMVGDIVDWKTTVQVRWPPLSFSESKAIINAVKNAGPFFNIKYYDHSTSTEETKKVYCGNLPHTIYSLSQAARYHYGIEITFIEQ